MTSSWPLGGGTDATSHCSLMREELQAAQTNTVSLWASGAEEEEAGERRIRS